MDIFQIYIFFYVIFFSPVNFINCTLRPLNISVVSGTMGVPMKGHTGTIRSVAFRGGDRDQPSLLASAGAGDNITRLWDVSTGTVRYHVNLNL